MKLRIFLVLLLIIVAVNDEVFAGRGGSRSGGRGSRIFSFGSRRSGLSGSRSSVKTVYKTTYKTKYTTKYGSYKPYSSMSSSRRAAYFAGGTLAGLYIGSHLRPRVHSYHDLRGYEICEGQRVEYMPDGVTVAQTYKAFICPDGSGDPTERSCCISGNGMGFCCAMDVGPHSSRNITLGSVFGIGLFAALVSCVCYVCCCKRRSEEVTTVTQTVTHEVIHEQNDDNDATGDDGTAPTNPEAEPFMPDKFGGDAKYQPVPPNGPPAYPPAGFQIPGQSGPGYPGTGPAPYPSGGGAAVYPGGGGGGAPYPVAGGDAPYPGGGGGAAPYPGAPSVMAPYPGAPVNQAGPPAAVGSGWGSSTPNAPPPPYSG